MTLPREMAVALWQAGVVAVDGYAATRAALDPADRPDRVLAVGKAAAAMARAAIECYGDVPALAVTKDGHGTGLSDQVEVIESAHPVPDARSLAGGRALREAIAGMAAGSSLLLLVSGGASALAEDLAEGKTLNDLRALNARLLAEGLDITAMNAERRKVSRIKGGGLLSGFRGAKVRVLAISDVPGDDIAVIGSGIGAVPKDAQFKREVRIVASNAIARSAAADKAREMGLEVLACEEALHDDLSKLVPRIGAQLRRMAPGVMIFGGEPTVVLPDNPGRGGRNQALALALAGEITGDNRLTVVVGGTDGTDGPTDAAGGIVDGSTWRTGAAKALARADSGSYLDRAGALLTTGPTGTNVMDLLIALRA